MSANGVWTPEEVQALLCIIGEEDVQRELDSAVWNEKVSCLCRDLYDATLLRKAR